ncbi:MAG: magnesium transporter CorA family protein [Acidimicrobiia bacterium]
MIRAWRYREGVDEPQAVDIDALPETQPDALLWIECEGPTAEEIQTLGAKLRLHKFIVEDLEHGEQRTKLDHYEDHFHVAVHDCELLGDLEETEGEAAVELVTREIDVVFGDGWLLSVCQCPENPEHDLYPIGVVRRSFERQRTDPGTTDEGFLLWALLDGVVDRYFLVSDAVDDRLDALQEVVLDDTVDRIRRGRPRELFDLSKAILRFRRAALPLREVVGQLLRREDPDISEAALAHFQDLYDHVLRVADLAESQRDVLTGLRDADLAVTSNQMSLVQQKIAAWGAILLVATLVTGALGMNFQTAPGVGWEAGFAWIAGVIAVLCLPLYMYFKRRKWL